MITRRTFTILAGAGLAAPTLAAPSLSPRRRTADPVRIGVIGVRGRGRAHIKAFKDSPDATVVAICDPDEGVIGPALDAVPDATYYKDIRALLDADEIDAVSVATPNHWHTLASVWALQAGKHVYVEKPLSHNIYEGRALVAAQQKYNLVVAHGTQARSTEATRSAMQWLNEGGLGPVFLARGLCYKRRESIGKVDGPQTPPATLDYDLWTGPAAMQPLMRTHLHYDWHWDFNTGNGDIGNQGVHQMDIARWGLGKTTLPIRVASVGGRLGYDDDGNTYNTQVAVYDYDDARIIFETRGLPTKGYRDTTIGVIFHCEGGYMRSAAYDKVVAYDHDGQEIKVFEGGGNHFQNFLDAVRSGGELNAPVTDGHISSAMCHMGNVSCMLGETAGLTSDPMALGRAVDVSESFARMQVHLLENGVDKNAPIHIGAQLAFNPDTEKFIGPSADRANALQTRTYRDGFRVEMS